MIPEDLLRQNGITLQSYAPGRYYTTCPKCSHLRKAAHRKLEFLGVNVRTDGADFGCNHCGWTGPKKGSGKPNGADNLPFHPYRDRDGVIRFRKVRNAPGRDPKCWFEKWDTIGWLKGKDVMKGVDTTILYRADEIAQAIRDEREIALAEGEKDCDRLWSLGIPATCNSTGAAKPGQRPKWTKRHSEQLRGAAIIVFSDHDDAGYAHADATCKCSVGVAKRIRRVDLKDHWSDIPKGGDVSDWLDRGGGTRDKLARLIAQAPDYEPSSGPVPPSDRDQELERLARLSPRDFALERKEATKRLGLTVADLNAAVNATRAGLNKPPPDADRTALDELNVKYSVVKINGATRVLAFEDVPQKIDGRTHTVRLPTYMRFRDFRDFHLNKYTVDASGKPYAIDDHGRPMHLGDWWLEHPNHAQYDGVTFAPGWNAPKVVNGYLNLWTGFAVEPKQGDWSYFREHMRVVLAAGDEAFFNYTIHWAADCFQHPDRQSEAALVLKGEEGGGKGLFGRAMCRIFGRQHSLHLSSPEHLVGRFNAHFQQSVVLFADEALAPADRKAEGQIKRIVTEPDLFIESKGINGYMAPNYIHMIIATNHDWVVQAGPKARRFAVQNIDEGRLQDASWFDPIFKEMENAGLQAMLFDLLKEDLGYWRPRQIVATQALAEQKRESLSPLDQWWLELLMTGMLAGATKSDPNIAPNSDYEATIEIEEDGGPYWGKRTRKQKVKRSGLFAQARSMSPKLKSVSDQALGAYLADRGCFTAWARRKRGWKFPPLAEARKGWKEVYPETVWPKDVPDWFSEEN